MYILQAGKFDPNNVLCAIEVFLQSKRNVSEWISDTPYVGLLL